MHLYPLIVTAVCLQQMSSADLHQSFAGSTQIPAASALAALHIGLVYTAAILETLVPTAAALMPDKSPHHHRSGDGMQWPGASHLVWPRQIASETAG